MPLPSTPPAPNSEGSAARQFEPHQRDDAPLEMWFWTITNPITKKRHRTTWRMTETDARERHGSNAVKVEGSLELRVPLGCTSAFLRDR